MADEKKPVADTIIAEVDGAKKLWAQNRLLAVGAVVVLCIIGLAWFVPKGWEVLKVLANPEVAELRQNKAILTMQLETLAGTTNALWKELAQRTSERDAKADQLSSAKEALARSESALSKMTSERDERARQLSSLQRSTFVVRVKTFNGNQADKRLTVSSVTSGREIVVFQDFRNLPGFDNDEGIGRQLLILP